mgnify:CR=1 FL=1|tara:strand:- start:8050 stop:8847 length:798 start_codon:yes stop_codon:yes gene_type:complete
MIKPKITIIGLGRVGKAFSIALSKAGYEITHQYKKRDDISELGDLVCIVTPDSEITKVSSKISSSFDDLSGKAFIHCSGAISSSVLKHLKERGAKIACFHPLKSITKKTISFKDIYFDLEGDGDLLNQLEKVAKNIGAKSIRVTPKEKELLHVSAVMASNYLVTLVDMALKISSLSNIPERTLMNALLPLMESSLENLKELNPKEALTGPIARRDLKTVQKHIKLLENEEELLNLYKKLGLMTLNLIEKDLNESNAKLQLFDLLK